MIEGLEINHLRTLDALYRFGSITVAAEQLSVSQQAISLQLKRLRAILGDRLFVRSGRGVAPTPYARRIEPCVRRVLAVLNDIPLPGALPLERLERTLTISATDYAQRVVIGPLLRELHRSMPGVRLAVVDIEGSGLTPRMHRGEIDLAITSSDPTFAARWPTISGTWCRSSCGTSAPSARR